MTVLSSLTTCFRDHRNAPGGGGGPPGGWTQPAAPPLIRTGRRLRAPGSGRWVGRGHVARLSANRHRYHRHHHHHHRYRHHHQHRKRHTPAQVVPLERLQRELASLDHVDLAATVTHPASEDEPSFPMLRPPRPAPPFAAGPARGVLPHSIKADRALQLVQSQWRDRGGTEQPETRTQDTRADGTPRADGMLTGAARPGPSAAAARPPSGRACPSPLGRPPPPAAPSPSPPTVLSLSRPPSAPRITGFGSETIFPPYKCARLRWETIYPPGNTHHADGSSPSPRHRRPVQRSHSDRPDCCRRGPSCNQPVHRLRDRVACRHMQCSPASVVRPVNHVPSVEQHPNVRRDCRHRAAMRKNNANRPTERERDALSATAAIAAVHQRGGSR